VTTSVPQKRPGRLWNTPNGVYRFVTISIMP
jgi:hypothetical protein